MDTIQIQEIKKKTVKGVTSLMAGGLINQIIAFSGNFILTIILSATTFGIYYVVTAIIGILNYFSDIGLAAALVQKQDDLKKEDYETTFTIQQFLVITTIAVFLLFSQKLATFFNIGESGLFLFRALLVSFFLSSLKTIPSVMLERKLEFGKKIIPLILETFTFYLVAIILAIYKFGVLSFAYAAVIRGVVGLIAIYILSPWRITLGFHKESAKKLLSFGIPLQGGSILALFKDDLLTVFLGKILTTKAELGYIGWSKKWSEAPLRLIMDNVVSATFPVYSRIAHDKEVLKKGIEKAIFFASLLIFPMITYISLFAKPLSLFIPHYFDKWHNAFLSLYLFSFSAIMASVSSPLVQALNAMGRAKTTFKLMTLWTALTWLLIPAMVFKIGFNGVALSAFIISITGFIPAFILRKHVSFSLLKSVYKPLITASVILLVNILLLSVLSSVLWGIILTFLLSLAIYILIMYFWASADIIPYLKLLSHRNA